MRMHHSETSRRRFLVAAITCSGLISTGMGAALLRASSAWAESANGSADELTRMARLLYPHDDIADEVYAEVIDSILSDAVDDVSTTNMLNEAISGLNTAMDGDWFEASENDQIAAMRAVADRAFFAVIRDGVRTRFYTHPKVWEHIGYPGSSVEYGGYIDRGFDDIDWLPEDA
jgi:hypothetical protein